MVGFFRKLMGKGSKLALAGALAGCMASTSIDLGEKYPELTPERKTAIEYKLLDGIEHNAKVVWNGSVPYDPNNPGPNQMPAIGFEEDMHEFVYHAFSMMKQDQLNEGVKLPGIEDAKMMIMPRIEMARFCGEQSGACNASNTIYMPNDMEVLDFLSTLSHEVGHTNYSGNKEFVSEASEMYSPIKIYMLSKPIGSLMLPYIFAEIPMNISMEEMSPLDRMYLKGRMYAVYNLNNYGGNIELALGHVAHSRTIVTETELQYYLDHLPGPTPGDQDFQAWNQLLDNYMLVANLTKDGHLTNDEALELVHYMKILNYRYNLGNITNDDGVRDQLSTLSEWYLISPYAANPNFRAEAASYLRDRLYEDIIRMGGDWDANKHVIFSHAKKILDFNADYPCWGNNPYTCPWAVRGINANHVYSYEKLMSAAKQATDQPSYMDLACEYVKQYIEKFYPGTVFGAAYFEPLKTAKKLETNNLLVWLANDAGDYKAAYEDYDEAKKFYQAAEATTCMPDGWQSYDNCLSAQQNAKDRIL